MILTLRVDLICVKIGILYYVHHFCQTRRGLEGPGKILSGL